MGDCTHVNNLAILLYFKNHCLSQAVCQSHHVTLMWASLGSIPQYQTDGKSLTLPFLRETLQRFISASPLSGWRVWNVRRGCDVSQSLLMLSDVAEVGLRPLPLTASWPISASKAPSLQRHMLDSSRKSGLSFTDRAAAICSYTFTPSPRVQISSNSAGQTISTH